MLWFAPDNVLRIHDVFRCVADGLLSARAQNPVGRSHSGGQLSVSRPLHVLQSSAPASPSAGKPPPPKAVSVSRAVQGCWMRLPNSECTGTGPHSRTHPRKLLSLSSYARLAGRSPGVPWGGSQGPAAASRLVSQAGAAAAVSKRRRPQGGELADGVSLQFLQAATRCVVRRRAAGSWEPGPRRRRDAVFAEPACRAKSTFRGDLAIALITVSNPLQVTSASSLASLPHCSPRPLHPSLLMCVRARASRPQHWFTSPLSVCRGCGSGVCRLPAPSTSLLRSSCPHSQGSTPAASPGAGAAKPPPPKQGSPPAAVRRCRSCCQRGIATRPSTTLCR
jgi:hypothetical protein